VPAAESIDLAGWPRDADRAWGLGAEAGEAYRWERVAGAQNNFACSLLFALCSLLSSFAHREYRPTRLRVSKKVRCKKAGE